MRIFITGATGQLAKSIATFYPQKKLFLASKDKLDITKKDEVIEQVRSFNPDIIFHFGSLTRGDECALNPDLAYNVNVKGTQNIIEACNDVNAGLLFVSTNEVFDGEKKKPYTERDIPNPITVVGKTKYEAEAIVKKNIKKHFIVRTSWLYSQWNSNFLHAVVKKALQDKRIELVHDEISTPTYSHDLSKAIKELIETGKYGLYHLSNEGVASRLEFAKKAFEIKKLDNIEIVPIPLSKYKRASKPPLYSALKNSRAKKLGIVLPQWEESLKLFLTKHKFNSL